MAQFTAGVFAVYFLGGAAIAVGAGQLIRPLLPHPHHHITSIIEIAVGTAMIAAAAMIWRHRATLARRDPPDFDPQGKSSWVLGASITAVELPTAFPYFAAIAAIVGSGLGPVRDLVLLLLFNVCFVLPLLGIIGSSRSPTTGPSRCSPRGGSSSSVTGRRCSPDWRWSRDCSRWGSA